MKKYWNVWLCVTLAAVNIPGVIMLNPSSILSMGICIACAYFCYMISRRARW